MTDTTNNNPASPLLQALREHRVSAQVVDIDHNRIRGGLAVESDYIVTVKPENDALFEAFSISKTYSAFRTFAQQLKKVAAAAKKKKKDKQAASTAASDSSLKLIEYCELVFHLIDAQRTAYLGKVNYMYVKVMAKQRKQIIDDVLSATCNYFPAELSSDIAVEVSSIIETFLLTDHVVLEDDGGDTTTPLSSSMQSNSSDKRAHPTLENLNPLAWINSKTGGGDNSSKNKGGGIIGGPLHNLLSVDTTAKQHRTSVVVPITRRARKSHDQREQEENELTKVGEDAQLLVDDDRQHGGLHLPNYARPVPVVRLSQTAVGRFFETNPLAFMAIAAFAIVLLLKAAKTVISMDGDIFLLVTFACYCLGLHTPRSVDLPVIKGTAAVAVKSDRSGRKLLRRSMIVSSPAARASVTAQQVAASLAAVTESILVEEEEEEESDAGMGLMGSPMDMFPDGAEIGSHFNCWSCPYHSGFHVRGPNYLHDKKKVPSQEYLFPSRGVDLFLTDACPDNVGRFAGVFGGKLREVPTFIINFRLPWGVLVFYSEIPKQYVPFLEAKNDSEKDKLISALKEMTPGERTTARWLMCDAKEKNKTLKIVPVVVDGPWVVKSVVGGKPALIGEKLPVTYAYQPPEGHKALYLEADLDVAASSAARGIMSVTRSYTQVLTIDLGFVIQGNASDELPEQMLMGARLHRVDPLTAPCLPASEDDLLIIGAQSSDEESV